MTLFRFSNNASTTLTSGVASGVTTLPVAANVQFPALPQYSILVDSEIMLVTGGTGTNSWTVARAQEGTSAASHLTGATVSHIITAAALNDFAARGIPTGSVFPTIAYTPPEGFLFLDGSAISRATYASLFSTMTFQTTGHTHSNTTIDSIPDTSDMFPGMAIEGSGIPAGATIVTIVSSTTIVISSAATTTVTSDPLTIIPYGNGGSTVNFLLPNATGKTMIGPDKTASVLPTALPAAVVTGAATHALTTAELASHKHGVSFAIDTPILSGEIPYSGTSGWSIDSAGGFGAVAPHDGLSHAAGSGNAHTSMQPSLTMRYMIKT